MLGNAELGQESQTSTCTGARTGFSPACASTLHLFCIGWADLGSSSEQTWCVQDLVFQYWADRDLRVAFSTHPVDEGPEAP